MAKTRLQKEEALNALTETLKSMESAVFTSVSGYTMEDANILRDKGRESGVTITMAKKTMLTRAFKNVGVEINTDDLTGSILTAIGSHDVIAPAKLMAEFAKGRDTIAIAGGVLEGRVMSATDIMTLATLPSREELYARLVGSINAPVSGFVNVLAGNMRKFLYALNAIQETKS